MKYFKPPWREELAPYGVEDEHEMAKSPCPEGYLARGFIAMNADLRIACDKIKKRDEEIARLRYEVYRLRCESSPLFLAFWRGLSNG